MCKFLGLFVDTRHRVVARGVVAFWSSFRDQLDPVLQNFVPGIEVDLGVERFTSRMKFAFEGLNVF